LLIGVIAVITQIVLGSLSALAVDIGTMTWTPRAEWINVKSPWTTIPSLTQGAAGDGVTDDTAAIEAVFNYVCNHSNYPNITIYFPPGTYKITSTITMSQPTSGMNVIGCGSSTVISWAGPTGGAMYASNGEDGSRYIGLVWEGNNTAAVAYECDPQTVYQGGIRHENESFRDINAVATYSYRSDGNGDYTTTPVPPTAAIVSGYTNNPPSYVGETQVWNCRFSNCTIGIAEAWNIGNFFCWFYDDCEFDNCGTGINMLSSGGNVITSCHFQNSTTADILGGGNNHIRHCTSSGSNYFFSDPGSLPNPADPTVIEDCSIDHWTNTAYAMFFQRALGTITVFDCTFTNPPAGSAPPIAASCGGALENHLIMSNNYVSGLPVGTQFLNNCGYANLLDIIPPGLRFPALGVKSASQTFLNTANFTESINIIDISQGTYRSQWTYPGNQNGLPDISAALQSAVTQAATNNNGTIVYIPTGIYNVSTTVNCTGSNYTIEGDGYSSELCWWGADNSTILSVTSPKISVLKMRLATLDNTIAGVTATSTTTAAMTFDDLTYNSFQTGNPGAGGANFDGPGLVISNLPANSTVWIPLLQGPLTVKNCGSSQILTKYLAQSGTTSVSGTTAQTGFLGTIFTEGGQQLTNQYDVIVNDNQDLIFGDYYVEQDSYNFSINRGSGTVTNGRVTVGGFNCASGGGAQGTGSQYLLNVNNYEGRVFYGSAGIENENYTYPVWVNQTGTNPVDIILAGNYPYLGWNITTTAAANVIATENYDDSVYPGQDIADTPSPVTPTNFVSMAQALDHFRQLEAVDLSVQNGLTTEGPAIAQYPFEGNVLDMSGTYNGTAHTVTYVGGMGGQAASFNGTSSYVQITNPVSTNFSISMWINTTDTGGTGQWYAGHGLVDGHTGTNTNDFGTALCGGKFAFGVGKTDKTLTSTGAVNDGKWHHLVATRNSTSGAMAIYVDGALNGTVTGPTGTKSAAANLRIGDLKNGGTGTFFSGAIDQVQIFNYTLSATDVANLYYRSNYLFTQPSNLVGYWKLDESSGGLSQDSSGNSFIGTWENGPTFTTDKPSKITFTDPGSLLFNGSNQYVTMGPPPQLFSGHQPRTICGWAKNNGGSSYHMFASVGAPQNGQGFWIGANGTSLSAGSWGDDMPDVANFWDSNWHFICLTYDGATAKLYADGTLKESASKPNWDLNPSVCYIGCYLNNGAFWNGPVDDVRIYNRALSATEVSALAAGNALP
jgi:hypothetical protein